MTTVHTLADSGPRFVWHMGRTPFPLQATRKRRLPCRPHTQSAPYRQRCAILEILCDRGPFWPRQDPAVLRCLAATLRHVSIAGGGNHQRLQALPEDARCLHSRLHQSLDDEWRNIMNGWQFSSWRTSETYLGSSPRPVLDQVRRADARRVSIMNSHGWLVVPRTQPLRQTLRSNTGRCGPWADCSSFFLLQAGGCLHDPPTPTAFFSQDFSGRSSSIPPLCPSNRVWLDHFQSVRM